MGGLFSNKATEIKCCTFLNERFSETMTNRSPLQSFFINKWAIFTTSLTATYPVVPLVYNLKSPTVVLKMTPLPWFQNPGPKIIPGLSITTCNPS